MKVIEYYDVNTFLNEYEKILLDKEAISQLILYNALLLRESKTYELTMFGAVVNDMDVNLLFCKLPSQSIIIHVVNTDNISQAVKELVDYLVVYNILINEIRGNNDVCLNFIENYKKHIEGSFVKMIGMDIMEIRQVNDIKPADGTQRLAVPDETKLVTDWMIESQLEALSSEMDYEAVLHKAAKYIDDKKVYLFEKDDIVVSMVIKERELVKGVVLTYVFTPVEYRGEGYAAANVYYLSKALLDEGYEFCTMLVDKKNPLSARSFEKIGYVVLEDSYEYKVFQPDD
jgi:predicted GNAT family acetyltransferase